MITKTMTDPTMISSDDLALIAVVLQDFAANGDGKDTAFAIRAMDWLADVATIHSISGANRVRALRNETANFKEIPDSRAALVDWLWNFQDTYNVDLVIDHLSDDRVAYWNGRIRNADGATWFDACVSIAADLIREFRQQTVAVPTHVNMVSSWLEEMLDCDGEIIVKNNGELDYWLKRIQETPREKWLELAEQMAS